MTYSEKLQRQQAMMSGADPLTPLTHEQYITIIWHKHKCRQAERVNVARRYRELLGYGFSRDQVIDIGLNHWDEFCDPDATVWQRIWGQIMVEAAA